MMKNLVLKNIKLIVYDFDGVLTDNRLILSEDGLESVIVNRADGLAINMIKQMGINQIILTSESNRVVEVRAAKLGIAVIKDVEDKKGVLLAFCKKKNIPLENVIYIGDDINDIEAMKLVGHPICPADAREEVKKISNIKLDTIGGAGVVRELLKYIHKGK